MLKKLRHRALFGISILAALTQATRTYAQSADALIDKLVDKGILSVKEANELREESDKNFTTAYAVKSGMPEWVNSLKWNGDFRGRYDGLFQDSSNFGPDPAGANTYANHSRDRFRYRARIGLTAAMSDNFEVGIRLGSGELGSAAPSVGASAFSANTTLGNDGTRKGVFVDLAYAKWTPRNWFQLEIGKMNDAFWVSDMIFDPDYNPEGAQEKLTWEPNDIHKVSFISGQWVIAENFSGPGTGANSDAYLFVNQLEWTARWTPKWTSHVAAGMYNFAHQSSISAGAATSLDSNPNVGASIINQNGTPASGPGSQNFNPLFAHAELTYALDSFPLFTGEFPISVNAEYANNPAAGPDTTTAAVPKYSGRGNQAYNFGFQLGSAKNKGNWQLSCNYKYIESASVWHGLNDDDFGFNGRGGTDVKGWLIKGAWHVYDPLTLGFSYFITEEISQPSIIQAHQQRLFVDAVLSF